MLYNEWFFFTDDGLAVNWFIHAGNFSSRRAEREKMKSLVGRVITWIVWRHEKQTVVTQWYEMFITLIAVTYIDFQQSHKSFASVRKHQA